MLFKQSFKFSWATWKAWKMHQRMGERLKGGLSSKSSLLRPEECNLALDLTIFFSRISKPRKSPLHSILITSVQIRSRPSLLPPYLKPLAVLYCTATPDKLLPTAPTRDSQCQWICSYLTQMLHQLPHLGVSLDAKILVPNAQTVLPRFLREDHYFVVKILYILELASASLNPNSSTH